MARGFAALLALVAFATVCLRGLVMGSALGGTLKVACLALWLGAVAGSIVGELARRAVEESLYAELRRETGQAGTSAERRGRDKG